MPRSATPFLPDPNLISELNAQIEHLGWAEFREAIALTYQQRLDKIAQKNLTAEELKKARFKKLSHEEKVALALCFLHQLISLHQQNLDTESTIQEIAIAETAFLERGYTPEFIAKNLHPLYINLIRNAISLGELKLTPTNSYSFEIPHREKSELVEVTIHYAQLYLKYQQPFYRQLSRSGTEVNNLKQDSPQPVRLQPYLDKVNQLLRSDKSTELAAGIAATSGRRFSEVIERGKVKVPQSPHSPYEFVFEGQLKKTDEVEPYITYSLVHASLLISAIERFRSLPKIQSLAGATIQKLNTLNPGINYQVKKHFQDTGIIGILPTEAGVTVQNLRSAYGAIATHFFCPNPANFTRFLSSSLGHLIGDELRDRTSSSTSHYFRYYLVDEQGQQIDSMGVKLKDESLSTSTNHPQNQHSIFNLKSNTKHLFEQKQQQMNLKTENETLLQLIRQAERVPSLEKQLALCQKQIASYQVQIANQLAAEAQDNIGTPPCDVEEEKVDDTPMRQNTPSSDATSSSDSLSTSSTSKASELEAESPNSHNLVEAISTLVHSLGAMTGKLDRVLDLNLQHTHPQSNRSSSSHHPTPFDQSPAKELAKAKKLANSSPLPQTQPTHYKQPRRIQTEALISHVIDLMIESNNQAQAPADKWRISTSLLEQVTSSKPALKSVFGKRKPEIDAHHQLHQISRLHNRTYHLQQQLSDFFDF